MTHTKNRNGNIDLFRLICSIMVVSIHSSPLSEFSAAAGFFTTEVLPRIAVPYFFAVSGYFYTKKLQDNAPIIPYLGKILLTYLFWSIPYFFIEFIRWGYRVPFSFSIECAYSFFITGSFYHFWFFPALFISIGITTLLWKLRCRKLLIPVALTVYIIGCLGCSHYQYGIQIPVLSVLYQSANFTLIRRILMMGFPFFICGYSVRLISESVKQKESRIHFTRIICIAVFLWGIELYWVISNNLFSSIVISPMLYPLVTVTLLVLLTRTCTISSHASSKCRAAANFMYYAHPICLMHLSLTPLASCPTLCFLITIILTFLAGSFLKKRKGRIIPLLIG